MKVTDAAREAGCIAGFSEGTVRRCKKEFYDNKGVMKERKHDEEVSVLTC